MPYRFKLLLLILSILLAAPAMAEQRTIKVGVYANEPKIMLSQDGQLSGIFGDLLPRQKRHPGQNSQRA